MSEDYHEKDLSVSLNSRLDRWLRRNEPYKSLNLAQSQIEKLLRNKKILVNGQKASASTRITDRDEITLGKGFDLNSIAIVERQVSSIQTPIYNQQDIEFLKSLILWEDEEICVLNKPCGLAVQGGTNLSYHLDGLLRAYGKGCHYRLVHRLDKETSGVMVVAKTLEKSIELADAFLKRRVEKVYWAIVEGTPYPSQGLIEASLLKSSEGEYEKVRVDLKKGKSALTNYRLIKSLSSYLSWISLSPRTGRTHQLRVHCSHIGHPILGDEKYGSQKKGPLYLHARQLTLPDGETGRTLTFVASPSVLMEDVLKKHKVHWEKYI